MLKPLSDFIRREKLYSTLFVLVLIVYSFAAWMATQHKPDEKDAASLKRFEKAEDDFQEKIKDPKALKKFLAENPRTGIVLQGASLAAFLALLGGSIVLYRFLFIPGLREREKVFASEDSTRWSVGMLVKVLLLFLFSSFLLTILLGVGRRWILPHFSDHFYILTHTLFTNAIGVVIIFFAVKKRGGSLQSVGFRLPSNNIFAEFVAGWKGYLAVIPIFALVLVAVSMVSNWLGSAPDPHPLVFMFLEEAHSKPIVLYSLLIAIILAPTMEELFFRGFCYPIFKHRFGSSMGMVLTSSIFAVIHGSLFAFWPIFVLGLILNYLYELRQSLIAPIVLHITHNALFIGYFFLAKQIILHS